MVELREAIRLKPNAAEPHLLLSLILRQHGDYPRAVEESRLALAADPGRQGVREQYLSTAIKGRLYTQALQEAEIGRKDNPADLKLWVYQALALQGLGRSVEAEALMRQAAAGNRESAAPWLFLGDTMVLRKEYQAALSCYEEVLKREPTNDKVMNNVAFLTAEHGTDLRRARELAAYLNWKYPDNPEYADTLGWVLVKQGHAEQAVPYLSRAVLGLPKNPEPRYHLGKALLLSGNKEQGRKELEAGLRLGADFNGAPEARKLLDR